MTKRLATGALAFIVTCAEPCLAERQTWKAGVAKVAITPSGSLWMAGYASRRQPSQGTVMDLFARALALEDCSGHRTVLVATDMLGFPRPLSAKIARQAQQRYNLSRSQLLLTSSHTHGGPVVDGLLRLMYDMPPEQRTAVDAYTRELEGKILTVIDSALADLRPARLSFGHAAADFGVNRRERKGNLYSIGVNREAPSDEDVPLLRVEDDNGQVRGFVFGYACHNTTAKDWMQFHGDYAGFAQGWLEAHHPGAVALFVAGCGADINPYPRGTIELARRYGERLAAAVDQVPRRALKPVRPPLHSAYEEFPVAFSAPPTRAELEARLQAKEVYVRRHASEMLELMRRDGRLPSDYPYPLEVWQFGSDLTLVALAGEVVVDYVLRLKKELNSERLWVAAYSNDVFAYIPSLRVLREGGYEAGDAMIYYGQPGPFSPDIEEAITHKIIELVKQLRGQECTARHSE